MREIKFRAWNRHSKRMILNNELRHLLLDTVLCAENLMQYTGLKDKNGVEIYEGDIVRDCNLYCIESLEGEKLEFNLTVQRSRCGWAYVNEQQEWADFNLTENVQVIGNIYENPELL